MCKYCKGKICNNEKKTVAEWNKCPYQRATWEVDQSIFIWLMDFITFGGFREIVFRYKVNKYSKI